MVVCSRLLAVARHLKGLHGNDVSCASVGQGCTTHLLIRGTAVREHTVGIADFVLLAASSRVLQVALEAVQNVTTAVCRGVRQIRTLEVVYLRL